MLPRTLRLDDTVIVLAHVRGFCLEPRYGHVPEAPPGAQRMRELVYTLVFLESVERPLSIQGDHLDALRDALDGDSSRLVLLESPYAGDVESNLAYARAAMRDCFKRGEFPYASHLLYTQAGILDDKDPTERLLGIEAGLAWGAHAARSVVYTDRGISDGMRIGIDRARTAGREVVTRQLEGWCAP